MDDTNAPPIDLNIDPDMITPQGDSPQATIPNKAPVFTPQTPGVIDITPGSTDTFPSGELLSNHIDTSALPEPNTIDITPSEVTQDTSPAEEIITPPPISPPESTPVATPVPIAPPPQATSPTSVSQEASTANPSPLFEDPDLVKLIK